MLIETVTSTRIILKDTAGEWLSITATHTPLEVKAVQAYATVLLEGGQTVQAIKFVRSQFGVGLKLSKAFCDDLKRTMDRRAPWEGGE